MKLENKIVFESEVQKIATVVRKGGVFIYPTETVYGVGGDAFNLAVIERVKVIKGREASKPMLILTDTWNRVEPHIHQVTPIHQKLMEANLPITLLFTPNSQVPKSLMGNSPYIGIRCTQHLFCKSLIELADCLLLSTSANLSGEPPTTWFDKLSKNLLRQVDLAVRARQEKPSLPSTVVKVEGKEIVLLRQGSISQAEIEQFL